MEKTILYIMGCGRSGSTILDILLSNSKDVFTVGELRYYFNFKGEDNSKKSHNAVFWAKVRDQILEKYPTLSFESCDMMIPSLKR